MKPIRTLTAVAGLLLCVACGVGTKANGHGLRFQLTATCSSLGGTQGYITATDSSGFTWHGSYTSTVTGPGGKALTGPAGKASSTGDVPNWRWDCYRQPPGTYSVIITDKTTGKQTTGTFTIK